MKKLLLIFCALCFTQAAFAALDRDYFDYTQSPEFQAIPVDTSAAINNTANGSNGEPEMVTTVTKKVVTKENSKGKKRIRLRNEGSSWINTYWNFGQPNYGETGRF